MAKTETKPAADKQASPLTADKPKFGIAELEEATGMAGTAIRVALRDSDFQKDGARWGWSKQADFDKVVKFLKNRPTREAKAAAPAADTKADKGAANATGRSSGKGRNKD